MAATQNNTERIYVIPLRESWMRVPRYKRARKAVVTIKEFVAKHMKVVDRDVDKVKIDSYLNNEIWFQGARHAPSKVKVKVTRDGDLVKVSFVDIPDRVKFLQAKHAKSHKKGDVKASVEEKKEVKTEEEKKEEVEKEKSAADLKEKVAEQHAKAHKHTTKTKETQIRRMALKK